MLCPVCRLPLVIVEYRDVELDACPDCQGLWFDAQELRQLFELAGVLEGFGELESRLERLPHEHPRRRCPRCDRRLVPVRAPSAQGELVLDECPGEDGIWFDAGELRALLQSALGSDEALDDVRDYLGEFVAPADKSPDDSPDGPPEAKRA